MTYFEPVALNGGVLFKAVFDRHSDSGGGEAGKAQAQPKPIGKSVTSVPLIPESLGTIDL